MSGYRWCSGEPLEQVKVENRVGHKSEIQLRVSKNTTVDTLLGLCAGRFSLEVGEKGINEKHEEDNMFIFFFHRIEKLK